jgi:hypothetical protein
MASTLVVVARLMDYPHLAVILHHQFFTLHGPTP